MEIPNRNFIPRKDSEPSSQNIGSDTAIRLNQPEESELLQRRKGETPPQNSMVIITAFLVEEGHPKSITV